MNYVKTEIEGAWYYGFTPGLDLPGHRLGRLHRRLGRRRRPDQRPLLQGRQHLPRLRDRRHRPARHRPSQRRPGRQALRHRHRRADRAEPACPSSTASRPRCSPTSAPSACSTTQRRPTACRPVIVDDLALRASAGVSVFWKSPMGPIRFDFSQDSCARKTTTGPKPSASPPQPSSKNRPMNIHRTLTVAAVAARHSAPPASPPPRPRRPPPPAAARRRAPPTTPRARRSPASASSPTSAPSPTPTVGKAVRRPHAAARPPRCRPS